MVTPFALATMFQKRHVHFREIFGLAFLSVSAIVGDASCIARRRVQMLVHQTLVADRSYR
jgi:hypothetical protein